MEHDRRLVAATDPAAAAAGLMVRVGFGLIVIVIPLASVVSRRAIVILFPIAACTLIAGALMRIGPGEIRRRLLAAIGTPVGFAAVMLAGWMVLSLAWTPFPREAAERLGRGLGTAAIGLAAARTLPRLMRGSNLHLVSLGVFLLAVSVGGASLATSFRLAGIRDWIDPATIQRAAALLMVLVWAAVAWMLIKDRRTGALLWLAGAGAAIVGSADADLLPALGASLAALAIAWRSPRRAATFLGVLLAGFVVFAPGAAVVAKAMAPEAPAWLAAALAPLATWGDPVLAEPLRVLTGHGFDTLLRARLAGLVPWQATGGLVAEIWFELGLLGALFLAALIAIAFHRTGRLGLEMAPATIAALAGLSVFIIIDASATQTWWLHSLAVAGIAFVAVAHGRYRTVRPRVDLAPSPRQSAAR